MLILASARPLAGKTTIAAGLALALAAEGGRPAAFRVRGDAGAAPDAVTLAALAGVQGQPQPVEPERLAEATSALPLSVIELPAGTGSQRFAVGGAGVVGVIRYGEDVPAQARSMASALGAACLGVAITFLPARLSAEIVEAVTAAGVKVLAALSEDKLLASPTLGDVITALDARATLTGERLPGVMEGIYISSISADPNQEYAARLNPSALVIRSDKPDQQLAALYAGVPCLIISGQMPVLPYVLARAEEDGVPLLFTHLSTVEVVRRLERLYGETRLTSPDKAGRSAALLADTELLRLFAGS